MQNTSSPLCQWLKNVENKRRKEVLHKMTKTLLELKLNENGIKTAFKQLSNTCTVVLEKCDYTNERKSKQNHNPGNRKRRKKVRKRAISSKAVEEVQQNSDRSSADSSKSSKIIDSGINSVERLEGEKSQRAIYDSYTASHSTPNRNSNNLLKDKIFEECRSPPCNTRKRNVANSLGCLKGKSNNSLDDKRSKALKRKSNPISTERQEETYPLKSTKRKSSYILTERQEEKTKRIVVSSSDIPCSSKSKGDNKHIAQLKETLSSKMDVISNTPKRKHESSIHLSTSDIIPSSPAKDSACRKESQNPHTEQAMEIKKIESDENSVLRSKAIIDDGANLMLNSDANPTAESENRFSSRNSHDNNGSVQNKEHLTRENDKLDKYPTVQSEADSNLTQSIRDSYRDITKNWPVPSSTGGNVNSPNPSFEVARKEKERFIGMIKVKDPVSLGINAPTGFMPENALSCVNADIATQNSYTSSSCVNQPANVTFNVNSSPSSGPCNVTVGNNNISIYLQMGLSDVTKNQLEPNGTTVKLPNQSCSNSSTNQMKVNSSEECYQVCSGMTKVVDMNLDNNNRTLTIGTSASSLKTSTKINLINPANPTVQQTQNSVNTVLDEIIKSMDKTHSSLKSTVKGPQLPPRINPSTSANSKVVNPVNIGLVQKDLPTANTLNPVTSVSYMNMSIDNSSSSPNINSTSSKMWVENSLPESNSAVTESQKNNSRSSHSDESTVESETLESIHTSFTMNFVTEHTNVAELELDLAKIQQMYNEIKGALSDMAQKQANINQMKNNENERLSYNKLIKQNNHSINVRALTFVSLLIRLLKKTDGGNLCEKKFFLFVYVKILEHFLYNNELEIVFKQMQKVVSDLLHVNKLDKSLKESDVSLVRDLQLLVKLPDEIFDIAIAIAAKTMKSPIEKYYLLKNYNLTKYSGYIQKCIERLALSQFLKKCLKHFVSLQNRLEFAEQSKLNAPEPNAADKEEMNFSSHSLNNTNTKSSGQYSDTFADNLFASLDSSLNKPITQSSYNFAENAIRPVSGSTMEKPSIFDNPVPNSIISDSSLGKPMKKSTEITTPITFSILKDSISSNNAANIIPIAGSKSLAEPSQNNSLTERNNSNVGLANFKVGVNSSGRREIQLIDALPLKTKDKHKLDLIPRCVPSKPPSSLVQIMKKQVGQVSSKPSVVAHASKKSDLTSLQSSANIKRNSDPSQSIAVNDDLQPNATSNKEYKKTAEKVDTSDLLPIIVEVRSLQGVDDPSLNFNTSEDPNGYSESETTGSTHVLHQANTSTAYLNEHNATTITVEKTANTSDSETSNLIGKTAKPNQAKQTGFLKQSSLILNRPEASKNSIQQKSVNPIEPEASNSTNPQKSSSGTLNSPHPSTIELRNPLLACAIETNPQKPSVPQPSNLQMFANSQETSVMQNKVQDSSGVEHLPKNVDQSEATNDMPPSKPLENVIPSKNIVLQESANMAQASGSAAPTSGVSPTANNVTSKMFIKLPASTTTNNTTSKVLPTVLFNPKDKKISLCKPPPTNLVHGDSVLKAKNLIFHPAAVNFERKVIRLENLFDGKATTTGNSSTENITANSIHNLPQQLGKPHHTPLGDQLNQFLAAPATIAKSSAEVNTNLRHNLPQQLAHPSHTTVGDRLNQELQTLQVCQDIENAVVNALDQRFIEVSTFLGVQCLYCQRLGRVRKALVQCSVCKTARYCDVICQRDDWKNHQPDCQPY
ncbi:uncharacterized protein LOC111056368 isoform X2 [Nilaparvata lugens]|uniref:uncharacterized protein LOC111056368 isoform X2 n=1 Tax=Nilaparvata lugens TaxID=108931 RepID=UPI00193DF37A|nr:uncharacterized protein LOC111056368 isoform X2 [Nilaparvata lugens]